MRQLDQARNTAEAIALLGKRLGIDVGDGRSRETFDRIAKDVKDFAGLSYDDLGEYGRLLNDY